MSEQTSPQSSNTDAVPQMNPEANVMSDVNSQLDETVPKSDTIIFDTDLDDPSLNANLTSILHQLLQVAAVQSASSQQQNNHVHRIDAGMVEVALALSGIVFAAAAIVQGQATSSAISLFSFLLLVIATDVVALWFLAAYCVQEGIVTVTANEAEAVWTRPKVILNLFQDEKAGIYRWLAFCILGSFAMFFIILIV